MASIPKSSVSLKGGTRRTKHPKLHAVLKFPAGSDANLRNFVMILPKSQFIDPKRVDSPCIRPRFDEENCPKASILGHAKAYTPAV